VPPFPHERRNPRPFARPSGCSGRRTIAAAATHHATRSNQQIAQEILQDAARIDAAKGELFCEARGDELPEGAAHERGSRKVLREPTSRGSRRARRGRPPGCLGASPMAQAPSLAHDRVAARAEGGDDGSGIGAVLRVDVEHADA
jgi:hypothetical protein